MPDFKSFFKVVRDHNFRKMVKWQYIDRFAAPHELARLHDRSFSLLSNTCVGVGVYHKYGLPYSTPTVGTLIITEEYLRLLENLRYYLSQPLSFVKESKYPGVTQYCKGFSFPIGLLGNGEDSVEILFKHCKTEDEAYSKWTRRMERFNYDNLFVMMTDSAGADMGYPFKFEYAKRFDELPYRKVLFTCKPLPFACAVYIKNNMRGISVVENMMYNRKYERYMDLTAWLNSTPPIACTIQNKEVTS